VPFSGGQGGGDGRSPAGGGIGRFVGSPGSVGGDEQPGEVERVDC
jgi:hypothetical protein